MGDVSLEVPLGPLPLGGAGSATIRATRGLRYSAILLMTPPLPASRPRKTTTTRSPSWRPLLELDQFCLELEQGALVALPGLVWWGERALAIPSFVLADARLGHLAIGAAARRRT